MKSSLTTAVPATASAAPSATDVAVAICSRDRPAMLADALAALRAVLPAGVEIIVVDSGSTTSQTREVTEQAHCRYVRSDVPGLSIARNAALAASSREIVVFTDDDCAAASDFLPSLLAPFANPDVGAAAGLLRDESLPAPVETAPVSMLDRTVAGLDAGHGALMAFRRSTLLSLGGFDPLLGAGRHFGGAEDMDAFCRVLHAGLLVARVPSSVVTHVNTRTDDDYVALNANYGRGIGAMCAKWMRLSRPDGWALTARVVRRGIVRLARRAKTRRGRRGQTAFLSGLVVGYREARRVPLAGAVFVDATPPAAVITAGIGSSSADGEVRA